MKNMFVAASRSRTASILVRTMAGKSLETSFESGRDLQVYNGEMINATIKTEYPMNDLSN